MKRLKKLFVCTKNGPLNWWCGVVFGIGLVKLFFVTFLCCIKALAIGGVHFVYYVIRPFILNNNMGNEVNGRLICSFVYRYSFRLFFVRHLVHKTHNVKRLQPCSITCKLEICTQKYCNNLPLEPLELESFYKDQPILNISNHMV